MDYHKELKKKLDANYQQIFKECMEMSPDSLFEVAEEIAAAKFFYKHLLNVIDAEDASWLLSVDNPLERLSGKLTEITGLNLVDKNDIWHCLRALEVDDSLNEMKDGGIYQLIDRAKDEMQEYAQRVKQLSVDEVFQYSAETAAKENLLCAIIHDSYDLEDADLTSILEQEAPLDALYRFLRAGRTDLSSESAISGILTEYNAQFQKSTLSMGEGVTMC